MSGERLDPAAVARLAFQGLNDHEIAARLGSRANTVQACRRRHDIPSPVGSGSLSHTVPTEALAEALAALTPPAAVLTYDESQQAVCAQTDAELFFPPKGGSSRDAKTVCLDCPIRLRCLEVAIANGERHGIYGGLTPAERRRVAQGHEVEVMARPRAAHGTVAGWRVHRRNYETPCAECAQAREDWLAALRDSQLKARRSRDEHASAPRHGTNSGYITHRKNSETACDECKTAHNEYVRQYRAQHRQEAAA